MLKRQLLSILVIAFVGLAITGCEEPKKETTPAKTPAPVTEKPQTSAPKPTPTPEPVPAPAQTTAVIISTSMGDITLELFADKSPITVANFLRYVNDGFYDGTVFHRVMKGFMIQGGGLTADMNKKTTRDPIKNETQNRVRNVRGTITMARQNALDSATSQFFINHVDNRSLDFDGPYRGYAVFGKVTNGMDVVDKIAMTPVTTKGGRANVPVKPIIINSIKLAE